LFSCEISSARFASARLSFLAHARGSARSRWRRSPRAGGASEVRGNLAGPLGTSPRFHQTVAQTSHAAGVPKRGPPFGLDLDPKAPLPCGAFLWLLLHPWSPDKEIFQHMLPIHRRERMLADPAMDQSMREVGVSFHAHDLVARPAVGANKLRRTVLSHLSTPR